MALLTFEECKNGLTQGGSAVSSYSLFDTSASNYTGYTAFIRNETNNACLNLYGRAHSYDEDAGTFSFTMYLFGRKNNSAASYDSSGANSKVFFEIDGNTWSNTYDSMRLESKTGKVRLIANHTFTGLNAGRSSSGNFKCTWTGIPASSELNHTYTLSKTLNFAGGTSASASAESTTSLKMEITNIPAARGFTNGWKWSYKKDSDSSYTLDATVSVLSDSTATSASRTFTELSPCTQYTLKWETWIRNNNPLLTNTNSYPVCLTGRTWYKHIYTNAIVATEPTVSNKTYTGSAQTGVSAGTGINWTGDARTQTNAGTYTCIGTPQSEYNWTSEGCAQSNKETKSYTWTIAPKSLNSSDISFTLDNPTVVYHGGENKPTPIVVDKTRGVTLVNGTDYTVEYSGDLINAGSATVKITGKGNYTGTASCTFVIKKATPSLSVSPTSLTLKSRKTANVTFSKTGDGIVYASSSNTNIATVQDIVGNTITVLGVKKGTCTITINCAATTNYNAISETVSIVVESALAVRYGTTEIYNVFYGDKQIVAIFYGDKEII